jgi:hypothetical protein
VDFFSAQNPGLQGLVQTAVDRITIREMRVTDVHVEASGQTRIRAHFRVNAHVALVDGPELGHQPTRWIFTWQREADRWLVVEFEQLDPLTGDRVEQASTYLKGASRRGL